MAELKTQVNKVSVKKFLDSISDPEKHKDCTIISNMMETISKSKPEMWGASIIGFGRRKYTYANGKESEWMIIGFSPRKQNIVLYGLKGNTGESESLVKLGKYKEGAGCLYINKLSDISIKELEKIIKLAIKHKK